MSYKYTVETFAKINSKIPESIINALHAEGWNALGIYEIVRDVLKEEKREQDRKVSDSGS